MPKQPPNAHFDVAALLTQVLQSDLGLIVSTNNPSSFRRILYTEMRRDPSLKCFIYSDPQSASRFFLLKEELAS